MECSPMRTAGQLNPNPVVVPPAGLSGRRSRWDAQRAWIPDHVRDRIAGTRSTTASRRAAQTRRLFYSDALIISCALLAGQFLRFDKVPPMDGADTNYTLRSFVLAVLWMGFLALGIRSTRFTRRGLDEYVVWTAVTTQLFGAVAILCLLMQIDLSRGYLAIALPLGLGGLIVNHWVWRQVTARRHRRGLDQTPLLVVGGEMAAAEIAAEFDKDPFAEYHVVGICTPGGPTDTDRAINVNGRDVPIVGRDQMVIDAVSRTSVHAV